MNDTATPIETLFEKVREYNKTSIDLLKLHAVDKSADVASSLVSRLAFFMFVSLSIIIINIGVALWIGNYFENTFYGFFIIGGFYALIGLVLHLFRHEWLKSPISNTIISQMLKQKKA